MVVKCGDWLDIRKRVKAVFDFVWTLLVEFKSRLGERVGCS